MLRFMHKRKKYSQMDNLQQKILGDNKIMLGIVIGQEAIYVPIVN